MNDDFYLTQSDYIRKLIDQQNNLEKKLRSSGSSGMFSAMVEAQRRQEQFYASGIHSAIADAQRVAQEQIRSSGILSVMAEDQRIQAQFHDASIHSAIAAAQRVVQEQIRSSGVLSVMAEAQRIQEQFHDSGIHSVIAAAQRAAQEQIRSSGILSVMAEDQRIQAQFHDSSIHGAIAAAQRVVQEQIRSSGVLSVMAEAQRIQEQFHDSGIHSVIAAAQRAAQEQIRSSGILSVMAEDQRMQTYFASSVITRLGEMAENLRSVDYIINRDGTIASQNSVFKQSDVQKIIESCLEATPTADKIKISFETNIDNILNDIAKQHPIIAKLIVNILLVLFLSFISANYLTPPAKIDYALLAKEIKKEVHQVEIGTEFYRYYRFVSAPSLTVRSKNSVRSRYVGKLYFGYLVRVVHKKNWSLIEYRGKEGEVIIQGWVFTRYIKRFDQ